MGLIKDFNLRVLIQRETVTPLILSAKHFVGNIHPEVNCLSIGYEYNLPGKFYGFFYKNHGSEIQQRLNPHLHNEIAVRACSSDSASPAGTNFPIPS